MQEKKQKRAVRTFITILLPVLCLLLIAAPALETMQIETLYRRANETLIAYKAYVDADERLRDYNNACREQARLFLNSGSPADAEAYFSVTDSEGAGKGVDVMLKEAGDPCNLRTALGVLEAEAGALRETERHAMKLAALSYGLAPGELPETIAEYPVEEREDRLVSEQKRDEAGELLYGSEYCEKAESISEKCLGLFSGAETELQEQIRSLNAQTEYSLRIQHILLGVSAAGLIGLILFLRYQARIDAKEEHERLVELEEAKCRAEAEDRTKTAFLLNISHDIRMPMNEVLSFANLAEKHIGDENAVRGMLSKIRSSSGHMINIVNDILELNRLENDAVEITEVSGDMLRCGEELEMMVRAQAAAKGVTYSLEIGSIENRYVYLDIMHTVRLLVNLVVNGIKYTPAGGKVTLSVEQEGAPVNGTARYVFRVKDTGVGMNSEFVKRLFEPYAREKDREEGIRGAGLGLTITKKLTDSMGGTISVQSEPGKGSEFTVILPFRVQTPAEITMHYGEAVEKDNAAKAGRATLREKRILLADDNELSREIMSETLHTEGARTVKAEDGQEALRLFVENPEGYFDLILLDTDMPGMNGFEAAVSIRSLEKGSRLPIIAVTGAMREEDRVNALSAGMNGVLEKPLNVGELLNIWSRAS